MNLVHRGQMPWRFVYSASFFGFVLSIFEHSAFLWYVVGVRALLLTLRITSCTLFPKATLNCFDRKNSLEKKISSREQFSHKHFHLQNLSTITLLQKKGVTSTCRLNILSTTYIGLGSFWFYHSGDLRRKLRSITNSIYIYIVTPWPIQHNSSF